MSAGVEQKILLHAIAFLELQYRHVSDSCMALSICRQYGLLARGNADEDLRESYNQSARVWLLQYLQRRKLPPQLQSRLADFVLLRDLN